MGLYAMTQLIRDLSRLKQAPRHGVVTIGNFDGVHLGHQALFKKMFEYNAPTIVVCFEPHPQEFFSHDKALSRLTSFREKFRLLSQQKIATVVLLHFNADFADWSAERFIEDILQTGLNANHVVVGHDFHFGKQRQGNIALLQQHKKFSAEEVPAFLIDDERVSSSGVRQLLAEGNFEKTVAWLGRPWTISGHVMYGDARGRSIGFPTANIHLGKRVLPIRGVYVVRLHGLKQKGLPGVANVGVRPTVDGTKQILEVHLFNFDENIYGQRIEVEFCQKLRDEKRFENLDLLVKQIGVDAEAARQYFQLRGE